MTLTRARTIQYIGILFSLMLIAVGYWYFSVRAGVKSNTSALQPQGTGQLDSGLAGYWPLDNGSGTTATDLSTNGNNATLTNGPTWTIGQIGGAVDFDASDDHLSVPTPPYSNDALTMGAWVKIDATTATARAIYSANCFAYFVGWQLEAVENTGSASLLEVNFRLGNTSTVVANDALPIGQWTHIVATYSNSSTNIYINGRLVQSGSGTAALTGCGGEHYIGADPARFGANSNALSWDGALDEVRMYTRAFSSDEVGQLYRLTSPTSVDTSLKGYWSFNAQDMNGTTVFDRSGAGNTGTLTGGPTIDNGVSGQALNFDGSDDYVSAGTGASLENSVFTYSAWVKPTSVSGEHAIVGGGSSAPRFTILSGNLHLVNTGIEVLGTSTSTVPTNTWSHVAVTYDVSGNYVFYLNGVAIGSGTNSTTFDFSSSTFLINGVAGNYLAGMIDEVRSYNRVLTAAEIKSLYDRVKPDATNSSSSQAQGTGRLDSGLAGYWPLDNGSGTTATDVSTNGNNGTLTNGPTWTTGQIGSAVDFDGTNDYINAGTDASLVFTSKRTLSAWIYIDGTMVNGDTYRIIYKHSSGDTNAYYGLSVGHNGFGIKLTSYQGGGGGNISSSAFLNAGQWYHVAATFDQPTVSLYINGALDSTQQDTVGGGYASGSGTTYIGGISGEGYFNGKIDEVRVYGRPLSADEISQVYRLTAPTGVDTSLKGYWSFNGQDMNGTTAFDRSGTGNNGTLTNGPTIVRGISGQALNLDGSNDYVDLGVSTPYQFANTTFTVTGWFKTGTTGQSAFMAQDGAFGGGGWWLGIDGSSGGKLSGVIKNTDGGQSGRLSVRTGFNDNNWHQFAFVVTTNTSNYTANNFVIYADGVLQATTTNSDSSSGGMGVTSVTAKIGTRGNGGDVYFVGGLDEIRVYNRTLSEAEIKAQYDAAVPDKTNTSVSQAQGTGRLDSGLAGYWKLDEGTGTSAADASTNGSTGTLTNGPTWMTGQIGSGVDFDGSNDYIDVGSNSALNFTENALTIAAWIYPQGISTTPSYFQAIFDRWSHGCTGYGYSLSISNHYLAGNPTQLVLNTVCGVSVTTGDAGLVNNAWQHVAVSLDAGKAKFYVNGRLVPNYADNTVPAPLTYGGPAYIGNGPGAAYPFDGGIDEVRVYNRGLSADEIGQLYRLTAPTGTDTSLKGYWSLNGQDMTATTAFDRSGGNNNGTLTNGPAITRGKLGQALSFDGSGDYINLGNTLQLSLPMTVSAWVNMSSLPGSYAGIFTTDKTDSGPHSHTGMWLQVNSSGIVGTSYGSNDACASSSRRSKDGTTSLVTNTWYHVTAVVQGATNMQIYVNGVDDGGTYTGEGGSIAYTANNAAIGRITECTDGSGRDFPGKIDEVRIYNRALSAEEVQALYKQNK